MVAPSNREASRTSVIEPVTVTSAADISISCETGSLSTTYIPVSLSSYETTPNPSFATVTE